MKKIIILTLLFICFILGIFAYIYTQTENTNSRSSSPTPADNNINTNKGLETSKTIDTLPAASVTSLQKKEGLLLSTGSVLETSWKAPREASSYSDGSVDTLIGGEDSPYAVYYRAPGSLTEQDEFIIMINTLPLSTGRVEAENKLSELLGVKKDLLCKLNVSVWTQIDEKYQRQNLGVSFCANATLLP